MPCTNCHRPDKPVVARGYCRNCYERWQRHGTPEYAPKRERHFCQIRDCGRPVVSHGLCDMHRIRLAKHGDPNNAGPDDWGAKKGHPLYNSWAFLRRYRGQHPIAPEWDDFLQFTIDLGERPSPKHKLYAADDSQPIGPGNYVWKEAILQKVEGEDDATYRRRFDKVSRALKAEAYQGYDLKKNYGLSLAEYNAMSERQGHKCAICGQPEGMTIRGKVVRLAVDHDHSTGAIRGLLCSTCNTAIGLLKESPDLFAKALQYLSKHA